MMRARDATGRERHLIVEVPADGDGAVHASVGNVTLVFSPDEVSKLRRMFLDAQAVALEDRGRW